MLWQGHNWELQWWDSDQEQPRSWRGDKLGKQGGSGNQEQPKREIMKGDKLGDKAAAAARAHDGPWYNPSKIPMNLEWWVGNCRCIKNDKHWSKQWDPRCSWHQEAAPRNQSKNSRKWSLEDPFSGANFFRTIKTSVNTCFSEKWPAWLSASHCQETLPTFRSMRIGSKKDDLWKFWLRKRKSTASWFCYEHLLAPTSKVAKPEAASTRVTPTSTASSPSQGAGTSIFNWLDALTIISVRLGKLTSCSCHFLSWP